MSLQLKGTVKSGTPDRRYYMIRVQVEGRRVVLSSGTRDRKVAERKEQEVVDELRRNPSLTREDLVALVRGQGGRRHINALHQSGGLTLKDALARCFADSQVWGKIKAKQTYRYHEAHLLNHFGNDRVLATLDAPTIKGYIEAQLDQGSAPATVNRRLTALSRCLKESMDWPDGIKAMPKIKHLKEQGARKFILTRELEKTLFDAILALDSENPDVQGGHPRKRDAWQYHLLFVFLVETGMRLGEALHLQWGDVKWNPMLLTLHRTEELKTGRARTVPMTDRARGALKEAQKLLAHPDKPFGALNARRAQHLFTKAKARAGIQDKECVIHSLRHACATRLLRLTGNLVMVRDWMGHSTIQTTADVYAHVETDSMLEGAAALSAASSGT